MSFYLSTGPELGFDPKSCPSPAGRSLFSYPRPLCGVPRTLRWTLVIVPTGKLIFDLKKEFTALRVFDPFPYLCDSSACYAMNNGQGPFFIETIIISPRLERFT